MKILEFPFPIEIGAVGDVDFSNAIASSTELSTELMIGSSEEIVSIQGSSEQQFVILGEKRLALPDDWNCPDYPIIRLLPDRRLLVVDTSYEASRGKNAWILNRLGQVEANFEVGSAAVEIVAIWGFIAVAYHPESAKALGFQVQPIQRAGIAFFDFKGRLVNGFNMETAQSGLAIENVRCLTALSRSQILFIPEQLSGPGADEIENPVVLYDCAARRPTVFSAPFARAEAVSMQDGLIHLASPEGWEDQIITFDPEKKISQHRGEFLGVFRGLEGGGFLAQLSSADYSVIVPEGFESIRPDGFDRLNLHSGVSAET